MRVKQNKRVNPSAQTAQTRARGRPHDGADLGGGRPLMAQTWTEGVGGDPRWRRPGRGGGGRLGGEDPQWRRPGGGGGGGRPHAGLWAQALAESLFQSAGPLPLCWVGGRVVPPIPEPRSAEAAPALTWPFSPGCRGADGLRAPAELAGCLRLAAHLCAADPRRQDDQVPITSVTLSNACTVRLALRVRDSWNPMASALHLRKGRPSISDS